MKKKKFIPLLHYLMTRAGWLVTKIYEHYNFDQSPFIKDFVMVNQNSWQKAESSVERDF